MEDQLSIQIQTERFLQAWHEAKHGHLGGTPFVSQSSLHGRAWQAPLLSSRLEKSKGKSC